MKIAVCGPATLSMLQHLVESPIPSGGYPFPGTSSLVIEYIRAGHEVVLITTASDITSAVTVVGPQLQIKIVPSRSRARSRALDFFAQERRGILSAISESQVDVIHAHWTYEFGIAARRADRPSLLTVHDWAPAIVRHNRHLYWYFRAAMQIVCLLMPGALSAPTNYLADKVSKVFRRHCEVIPNGVDLPHNLGPGRAERKPLAVGMLNVGFSERKNVVSALRAWRLVHMKCPDTRLFLAGPGYELGGPAEQWAIQEDCHKGVVFQGNLDPQDREVWYRSKDLFLHTSREESFGLVLIEAMASGTPVIAGKNSGAIPEITLGAASLIDISNPSEIAEETLRLLGSSLDRQDMIKKGLLVSQRYDLQSVASRFLECLIEISKSSGRP